MRGISFGAVLFFLCPATVFCQDTTNAILAQVGIFPFRSNLGGHWEPSWSARIGIKQEKATFVTLGVFVEYFHHTYAFQSGTTRYLIQSGLRHDIAVYPTVIFFGVFEFAGGAYFSWRDRIEIGDWTTSTPFVSGKKFLVSYFYQVGASTTIALSKAFGVPIGLYYRDQDYGSGFYVFAKVGLMFSV